MKKILIIIVVAIAATIGIVVFCGPYDATRQFELAEQYFKEDKPLKAIPWLQKSAAKGHREAQFRLYQCYNKGLGIVLDDAAGFVWLKKAAQNSHPEALFDLAEVYASGKGTVADAAMAAQTYRLSAEQNNATAQYIFATCCLHGKGIPQDAGAAVQWLKKSAGQNNADAQVLLGKCLSEGNGIERDGLAARDFFEKSAAQGNAEAMYQLGKICHAAKDSGKAVEWYRKSAEAGFADAQYQLAYCHETKDGAPLSGTEILKWYRKAAEQGHTEAQYRLALRYHSQKSWTPAKKLFQQAAEQGHADAQYYWGYYQELGRHMPKDRQAAIESYQKAVAQGNAQAQYRLGVLKEEDKDVTGAADCYRKAALQGIPEAQYKIACFHDHGIGVIRNDKEAVQWYRKAADNDIFEAQCRLWELFNQKRAELSPEQAAQYLLSAVTGQIGKSQPETESEIFRQACFNLGYCYYLGIGLEKNTATAVKYFQQSQTPEARLNMGLIAYQGENGETNVRSALNWFREAAKDGLDIASLDWSKFPFDTARSYKKEDNADLLKYLEQQRNIQTSRDQWIRSGQKAKPPATLYLSELRNAAKQGNSTAQLLLALSYECGDGMPVDDALATDWLEKSAEQGHAVAGKIIPVFTRNQQKKRQASIPHASDVITLIHQCLIREPNIQPTINKLYSVSVLRQTKGTEKITYDDIALSLAGVEIQAEKDLYSCGFQLHYPFHDILGTIKIRRVKNGLTGWLESVIMMKRPVKIEGRISTIER